MCNETLTRPDIELLTSGGIFHLRFLTRKLSITTGEILMTFYAVVPGFSDLL